MSATLRIHVADHPLIAHKLTTLRDTGTDSPTTDHDDMHGLHLTSRARGFGHGG